MFDELRDIIPIIAMALPDARSFGALARVNKCCYAACKATAKDKQAQLARRFYKEGGGMCAEGAHVNGRLHGKVKLRASLIYKLTVRYDVGRVVSASREKFTVSLCNTCGINQVVEPKQCILCIDRAGLSDWNSIQLWGSF